jgi:hypothetical protein
MESDYLVFWNQFSDQFGQPGKARNATVVRLFFPPHAQPKGSILEDLVRESFLPERGIRIYGVIELAPGLWHPGTSYDLALGDGRTGSLEGTANGWVVHV